MVSCSNAQRVGDDIEIAMETEPVYNAVAQEKIGPAFIAEFNADSSFVLLRKEPGDALLMSGVFLIYDLEKQEVVHEDRLPQGKINWIRPYELEVIRVPGIIRGDERDNQPQGYRFHVKQLKKAPLQSGLKH